MQLTGIAQQVFLDRYALKDKDGNPIEQTITSYGSAFRRSCRC